MERGTLPSEVVLARGSDTDPMPIVLSIGSYLHAFSPRTDVWRKNPFRVGEENETLIGMLGHDLRPVTIKETRRLIDNKDVAVTTFTKATNIPWITFTLGMRNGRVAGPSIQPGVPDLVYCTVGITPQAYAASLRS